MKIDLWTGKVTEDIPVTVTPPCPPCPTVAPPITPPVPMVEAPMVEAKPLEFKPEDIKALAEEASKVIGGGREAFSRFIEAVKKLREQRKERAEIKKIEAMGVIPTEIAPKTPEFLEAIEREKKLKEVA